MNVIEITPAELMERKNAGPILLIDVRTPVEFQEMHVSFANLVPLDTLTPQVVGEKFKGTDPVYVVCRSGSRGKKACEALLASGRTNVFNIQGGTLACAQAGLPITHGKKVMSLERQVRIAAGFLVALGSFLGFFVDPRLGYLWYGNDAGENALEPCCQSKLLFAQNLITFHVFSTNRRIFFYCFTLVK